jgi:acyl-CoA synthetase (NDP forming)
MGLLNPNCIMVIGASRDLTRGGGQMPPIFERWGFAGQLRLVSRSISGTGSDPPNHTWFPDIAQATADGEVDIAVLAIGAKAVEAALLECAARNVKMAVVLAGDDRDVGLERLSDQVRRVAEASEMRIIGPNSAGMILPRSGVTACYLRRLATSEVLPGGHVAILTSSGAIGNELLWALGERGVDVGAWLSLGTEADLGMADVMHEFVDDADIRVVVTIVESVRDGAAYLRAARALAQKGKTVLAYRTLTSSAADAAAKLHSGSLQRAGGLWRAAAEWCGVTELSNLDALVDLLTLCRSIDGQRAVIERGERPVGIVTVSGGAGIAALDRGASEGIRFASSLSDPTVAALAEVGVGGAHPVDASREPAAFVAACRPLVADPTLGLLWVQGSSARFTSRERREIAAGLDQLAAASRMPVIFSGLSPFTENDLPVTGEWVTPIRSIDQGIALLAARERFLDVAAKSAARTGTERAASDLPSIQAPRIPDTERLSCLLEWALACGFAVPAWRRLAVPDLRTAEEIPWTLFPAVVKADSTSHKAQQGLVFTGLESVAAIRHAAGHLAQMGVTDILVQEEVQKQCEVLVGAIRDADAGLALIVGRGGTAADLDPVREVIPLPLSGRAVEHALALLTSRGILPGQSSPSVGALEPFAHAVANIMESEHDLAGLEFNPVILEPTGLWVVDIRAARQVWNPEIRTDGRGGLLREAPAGSVADGLTWRVPDR